MSIIGAFQNGLMGLNAASEAFGAISQNIANARTPGYRRVEMEFSTLLGGVDKRGNEPGGVDAQSRLIVEGQGAIENTGRPFDIALAGPGFFIFGDDENGASADLLYSRAGDLMPLLDPNDSLSSFLGNDEGRYLMGWAFGANGAMPSGSLTTLEAIPATSQAPLPAEATTTASLTATLPVATSPVETQISYYDTAGVQQSLRLTFTKTSANAWDMNVADASGAAVAGPFALTFDGQGALVSPASADIGGLFTLDLSRMTQRGTDFVLTEYDQDGLPDGEFIRYEISDRGIVNGLYTSGAIRPLYRIAIADFINPNQLSEESGSLFRPSDNSGSVELMSLDDTRITTTALELANFDLADGFSKLIMMQRAYSLSAQVIRTTDDMSSVIRDMA